MRSASIGVAAPGECDVLRGSTSPRISKWFGDDCRMKPQKIVDDGIGVDTCFGVGLRKRQAAFKAPFPGCLHRGPEVSWKPSRIHRDPPRIAAESIENRGRSLIFNPEGLALRIFADHRTEEEWRDADHLVPDECLVDREMMAFDAPGPGGRGLHGFESEEPDAELIGTGMDVSASMLDRFRGADPVESGHAITAEGFRQERRPCRSLVHVEVTEPKAGSSFRKIGPADSIRGGDRGRSFRP